VSVTATKVNGPTTYIDVLFSLIKLLQDPFMYLKRREKL
jgi:hypothetical protein